MSLAVSGIVISDPGTLKAFALTLAVNWRNPVGVLSHTVVAFATKFVPVIVSVPAWFASSVAGDVEITLGAGWTALRVKVAVPPPGPGVITDTVRFPTGSLKRVVRYALICVAVTLFGTIFKVSPPNETLLANMVLASAIKPVPLMMSCCPLSIFTTGDGVTLVMVGAGFCTVKLNVPLLPPISAGAGFRTSTVYAPARAASARLSEN